ncbi:MAG: hypothetical protein PUC82_04645 [bacterium]|nr:hypothetical protein [bacterium]
MPKRNVMLDSLLYVLNNLQTDISNNLNEISMERKRREYRDDILQLSADDVLLLATYFTNSNDAFKERFLELLHTTYNDKDLEEKFMEEFKNLYFLGKSNLTNITQYGAAKRVVMDFINKLKDQAISEKRLDEIKEKELAGQLFIVKKLIKYYLASPGSIEVKNIDEFLMMFDVIGVNEKFKNNALCVAIENNVKFYNSTLRRKKKNSEI